MTPGHLPHPIQHPADLQTSGQCDLGHWQHLTIRTRERSSRLFCYFKKVVSFLGVFLNPYFGHDIMKESLLPFLVFIVKYGKCEILQERVTISFIADRTFNRTFKFLWTSVRNLKSTSVSLWHSRMSEWNIFQLTSQVRYISSQLLKVKHAWNIFSQLTSRSTLSTSCCSLLWDWSLSSNAVVLSQLWHFSFFSYTNNTNVAINLLYGCLYIGDLLSSCVNISSVHLQKQICPLTKVCQQTASIVTGNERTADSSFTAP